MSLCGLALKMRLDCVWREREPVIVRTHDTPQAVLIPCEEFEVYQARQDRGDGDLLALEQMGSIPILTATQFFKVLEQAGGTRC